MVTLTIDGREIQAKEGTTVLAVAREHGIEVPALCYHDAVSASGACRLCMVEATTQSGRTRLVASCLYPVEEGLSVESAPPNVVLLRKMAMELLLARCPNSEPVKELARSLGVESTDFTLDDEDCVLCGLCVRVCQEVVGVSAISLVGRGNQRKVAPPFNEPSEVCIGCGACAQICPVDTIKIEDVGDTRIIRNWNAEFKLKQCGSCGAYFAPVAMLEYFRDILELPEEHFEFCPNCRKKDD